MSLHLHHSLFPQRYAKRAAELETCLRRNLENPLISRITVLDEGAGWDLLQHPKVRRIPTRARPRFADFLPHLEANATNVISNNDIHFDDSLRRPAGADQGAGGSKRETGARRTRQRHAGQGEVSAGLGCWREACAARC